MKILLLSDTHGLQDETEQVIQQQKDMDMYLHLGDIGFDLKVLHAFDIVSGNHDRFASIPKELIKTIEGRHVLCMHGNLFDDETMEEVLAMHAIDEEDIMDICMRTLHHKLAVYAKSKGCDTVFFGHTHHQVAQCVDGVWLVNPGSLCFGTPQSGYAVVEIKGSDIQATFYKSMGIENTK